MRDTEGLARQAIQEIAGDRLARGVADGVHEAVEGGPVFAELLEEPRDLRVVADIALESEARAELGGELGDPLLEALSLVAEGELRPLAVTGAGDAVGDRAVVEHARDEQALAGEKSHRELRAKPSGNPRVFHVARGDARGRCRAGGGGL